MSYIQPPSFANLKRKRSFSAHSASSPPTSASRSPSLNPHSHPPTVLKQLATAGLDAHAPLPGAFFPDFPHRPLPRDDDAAAAAAAAAAPPLPSTPRAQEQHVAVLAAVLQRSLEERGPAALARARRAFALLLRSEVSGRPLDVRAGALWAMGAEVLMREGGGGEGDGEGEGEEGARWGSPAGAARVRAYYEELVRLYPYSRHRPGAVSALTFWPVMVGVEVYDVYVEERAGGRRAEEAAEAVREREWEREEDATDMSEDRASDDGARLARLRAKKERLRLAALAAMRDVARRMDTVMEDPPYATSHEMLRLRGMVALYMGDLALPTAPRSERGDEEGRAKRREERARARDKFARILRDGGELDEQTVRFVRGGGDEDDEDDDGEDESLHTPVFSILPIRSAFT